MQILLIGLKLFYKYTDINDRLYSPNSSFSGGQSLKDKAFDAKFRLFKETEYIPEVALGFRDLSASKIDLHQNSWLPLKRFKILILLWVLMGDYCWI